MKKIDPTVLGILIITLIILGGILLAASLSSPNKTEQYQSSDQDRPQIEVSLYDFDLGRLKLSETKTQEVAIKNTGLKPLDLRNFSTSCDCTFVEVSYKEKKSPRFSMHNNSSWNLEISPGETATLLISYQPSLMPVQGEVSRAVYFKTNDPENPEVTISFQAFVE